MTLTPKQLAALRRAHVPDTGNKLAVVFEMTGVSQADVMRATDLSAQYINDVTRGRYGNITMTNAWKFAAFFGCDPGDLFPAQEAMAS
jgi:transcriptional regulator with XRE-family HTH domain